MELRIEVPSHKDSFDRDRGGGKPLAGVGDRAYVQTRVPWGRVDVLKGDQTFSLQVKHADATRCGSGSPTRSGACACR